jgi:hypothetical protein
MSIIGKYQYLGHLCRLRAREKQWKRVKTIRFDDEKFGLGFIVPKQMVVERLTGV